MFNILKSFRILYFIVCLFSTILLSIYSITRYNKNEDTTLVEITKFLSSDDAIYPSFSFCILPPYLDKKFDEYDDDKINASSYEKFLAGKFWDERFLKIEYDNVTISLSDNLIKAEYKRNSGHYANWTPDHFVSFRSSKRKCFTINSPFQTEELIFHTDMKINNSIFPDGKRSIDNEIKTYLHYPGQRFTAYYTSFHDFPSRHNMSEKYRMKYRIKHIDVTTRRNRIHRPCKTDWRNYDIHFMEQLMEKVGCRPPHWQSSSFLQICSNSAQMKHFKDQPSRHDLESFHQPCKVIDQIDYDYYEDDIHNEKNESYFWIRTYFSQTRFTDKIQVRAYALDDLVGTIGGYIGLFLGYALIQFPDLIELIYHKVEKRTLQMTNHCLEQSMENTKVQYH